MRAHELGAEGIVAELLPMRWWPMAAGNSYRHGRSLVITRDGPKVLSLDGCCAALERARRVLDVGLPGRKLFRQWSGLELAGDVGGSHETVDLESLPVGWQAETLLIHRWLFQWGSPVVGIEMTRDEVVVEREDEARPTLDWALDWTPPKEDLLAVWREVLDMEDMP